MEFDKLTALYEAFHLAKGRIIVKNKDTGKILLDKKAEFVPSKTGLAQYMASDPDFEMLMGEFVNYYFQKQKVIDKGPKRLIILSDPISKFVIKALASLR